ncbi:MAG: DUF664 domain-containing protein [Acidimicrobiales bacterium]
MTDIDEHGRPEPPLAEDEVATLRGFLEYQRATFAWKRRGLDAAGLATSVASSSMTLGGMMKHLALVEESWSSEQLMDRESMPPWNGVEWTSDPDREWRTARDDTPEQLAELWRESVQEANAAFDEALRARGLDQLERRKWPDGRAPSPRGILCHMIEEYARQRPRRPDPRGGRRPNRRIAG